MVNSNLDKTVDRSESKNVLNIQEKNILNQKTALKSKKRKYHHWQEIHRFAQKKYEDSGNGIAFTDLMKEFKMKKGLSQQILKTLRRRKVLFTGRDLHQEGIRIKGFGKRNPEIYYPTKLKHELIKKNDKNILTNTTATNLSEVDHAKAQN